MSAECLRSCPIIKAYERTYVDAHRDLGKLATKAIIDECRDPQMVSEETVTPRYFFFSHRETKPHHVVCGLPEDRQQALSTALTEI